MYLLVVSVKLETSLPPAMIREIVISNGRLVVCGVLHGPASCHRILFTAPEECFVHNLRPVLVMLALLSRFSTCSSPYLSFYGNPYLLMQLFIWSCGKFHQSERERSNE